jgi:hypothetical protein
MKKLTKEIKDIALFNSRSDQKIGYIIHIHALTCRQTNHLETQICGYFSNIRIILKQEK